MIILCQVIVHNFINSVCPNTRINTAALLSGSALSSVAFHLTLSFYFRKKIRLIKGKSACDMPYSYSDLYLSLYILIPVHDVYSFMAISRYVYIRVQAYVQVKGIHIYTALSSHNIFV